MTACARLQLSFTGWLVCWRVLVAGRVLLDAVLPPLCGTCWLGLVFVTGLICERCVAPLPYDRAEVIDTSAGRMGLSICCDLRFPLRYQALA